MKNNFDSNISTHEKKIWYHETPEAVMDFFSSQLTGLTSEQVIAYQKKYGLNKLPETKKETIFKIFLRQFQSPLLYVLMIAAIIAFILGEVSDSFIIVVVLFFNGIVGTFQEGKAQDALFALKKFSETESLVIRDGEPIVVPSLDLVPGDILILKEGDKVPADARLMEERNLATSESVLTGESTPVEKKITIMSSQEKVMVGDQYNMVFSGTTVARGGARAIVVATGIDTEMGKISEHIDGIKTEVPLQAHMRQLANIIIVATMIVITILFVIGLTTGYGPKEMLLVVLSLMVSVIPEGLPIVMTLILAHGVKRMSGRHVLVKRLQAVEALGHAQIIAVDKTGTLTKNELLVQKIYTKGTFFEVTGSGYDPHGAVFLNNEEVNTHTAVQHMAYLAAISASAQIFRNNAEEHISGDPTEAALVVFGEKLGYEKHDIEKRNAILDEFLFDYKKKYYATLVQEENTQRCIVVGAPEIILEKSSPHEKDELLRVMTALSEQGLRVIAVAEKETSVTTLKEDDLEHLSFVGYYAMKDGLRPEIPSAMEKARQAGMKVVMITGDHVITARAIAREAGIFQDGDRILSGQEIFEMSDDELATQLDRVTVFARVTPEHKMRIVQAYKQRGDIVAMTGDGVNDVPPLVAADLGVAMGEIGTEVTKEAADIVLLDDNFGNIPIAVEEGRAIFSIIKKTLMYLFSTNLAELLVIAFAVIAVMPIPMTPAQIVWLNLVTDSFLVLALAFLPRDPDLLQGKRDTAKRFILDRATTLRMIFFGVIITVGTLFIFAWYVRHTDLLMARTMAFLILSLFQLFRLWSVRSDTRSVFSENPFSYPWMVWASVAMIALQIFAIYMPFMNRLMETQPIMLRDWFVALGVACIIILLDEVRKVFVRINIRSLKKVSMLEKIQQ